jgi:cell division septal protein FtsQ
MSDKKKIFSITFFSALTCILVFLIFFSNKKGQVNKISQVEIIGFKLLSRDTYLKYCRLNQIPGNLTLTLIREKFLKHPYIDEIFVEQPTDEKIIVHLVEKKIEAIIIKDGESYFLTDDMQLLVIMEKTNYFDYPIISNSSLNKINYLEKIKNKDVEDAFKIIEVSKKINYNLYKNLSEINLRNGGEILLHITGLKPFIIFGKNGFVPKIYSLNKIINDYQDKKLLDNAGYIDLRYDKNVFIGLSGQLGIN